MVVTLNLFFLIQALLVHDLDTRSIPISNFPVFICFCFVFLTLKAAVLLYTGVFVCLFEGKVRVDISIF